jgi:hypothetical protein
MNQYQRNRNTDVCERDRVDCNGEILRRNHVLSHPIGAGRSLPRCTLRSVYAAYGYTKLLKFQVSLLIMYADGILQLYLLFSSMLSIWIEMLPAQTVTQINCYLLRSF